MTILDFEMFKGMIMKKLISIGIGLLAFAFLACSDDEDKIAMTSLKISSENPEVTVHSEGNSGTVQFLAAGGNVEIRVLTDGENWTVVSGKEGWCNYQKEGDKLILSAEENTTTALRSETITIYAGDGDSRNVVTLEVTQEAAGAATLSINPAQDTVAFTNEGGIYEVSVETNQTEWTVLSNREWCQVAIDKEAGKFTISLAENRTINLLEAWVTIVAGEGENIVSENIVVTQSTAGDNMIIVLEVGATTENVGALPFEGTVSCTIDWGDGTRPERVISSFPRHTYEQAGVYEVSILGQVSNMRANDGNYFDDKLKTCVKAVKQWGRLGLTSLKYGFYKCVNLEYLAVPEKDAFSELTTVYSTFYSCTSLKNLPEGLFENAPKVTEFYECFSSCTSLETVPDRLFANCSEATRFFRCFWKCESLKSVGEDVFDGCVGATSFGQTFFNCTSLTTVPVDLFDSCKGVTDFSNTFGKCSNLTGESPYTLMNGVKVHLYERADHAEFTAPTNTRGCFSGCISLTDYAEIQTNFPAWL